MVEKLLQQLILVVIVVQLNNQRVKLLRLLQQHVGKVLLGLDRSQYAF